MDKPALLPDDDTADRLRAGDEDAFRHIMDGYFPIITHFALRIVGNRAAAEDIAEETFIKLWQGRERVTHFQSVKAFLFIAARNGCLNELRSGKNLARREQVFAGSGEEEEAIDREIIRAEVWAEIWRAADQLPGKMREVFRLGFVEGLPNREIAKVLGVSVNTVKGQKARALELLREKLKGSDILPAVVVVLLELWQQRNG
jgi:RNA polymerase sigma-70 factor (family 1)